MRLSGQKLSLGRFERREGEVLLRQDVLGRKLVNVESGPPSSSPPTRSSSRASTSWWRVVGVDPSRSAEVRRWLPGLCGRTAHRSGRSWTGPTSSRSSVTCRRRGCASRSASSPTCIPPEIADLVEAASHEEGEEIIKAVGQDRELEADVFEELDEHHQQEFIGDRSDEEIAALISRMATDDAADLIVELDQDRRGRVLALLPPPNSARSRRCSATTRRPPAG